MQDITYTVQFPLLSLSFISLLFLRALRFLYYISFFVPDRSFLPGRERSPGGSLSVLVKLLCSLMQSCRMSPPACILSSGSPRRVKRAKVSTLKHNCLSSAKKENSPSSGDRDSATSSVAVACKKKKDFCLFFVCSKV